MPYIIKKAVRDAGVLVLGFGLLFVSAHAADLGPELGIDDTAVVTVVAVASAASYRKIREQNPDLFSFDEPGA